MYCVLLCLLLPLWCCAIVGSDSASFVVGNSLTSLTHIVVNSDNFSHCFLCLLKLLFVANFEISMIRVKGSSSILSGVYDTLLIL